MKKLVCILLSIAWLLAACSSDGRMQLRLQTLNTYGRETINSNYNWKWDELFERLGYTVVETSSE